MYLLLVAKIYLLLVQIAKHYMKWWFFYYSILFVNFAKEKFDVFFSIMSLYKFK